MNDDAATAPTHGSSMRDEEAAARCESSLETFRCMDDEAATSTHRPHAGNEIPAARRDSFLAVSKHASDEGATSSSHCSNSRDEEAAKHCASSLGAFGVAGDYVATSSSHRLNAEDRMLATSSASSSCMAPRRVNESSATSSTGHSVARLEMLATRRQSSRASVRGSAATWPAHLSNAGDGGSTEHLSFRVEDSFRVTDTSDDSHSKEEEMLTTRQLSSSSHSDWIGQATGASDLFDEVQFDGPATRGSCRSDEISTADPIIVHDDARVTCSASSADDFCFAEAEIDSFRQCAVCRCDWLQCRSLGADGGQRADRCALLGDLSVSEMLALHGSAGVDDEAIGEAVTTVSPVVPHLKRRRVASSASDVPLGAADSSPSSTGQSNEARSVDRSLSVSRSMTADQRRRVAMVDQRYSTAVDLGMTAAEHRVARRLLRELQEFLLQRGWEREYVQLRTLGVAAVTIPTICEFLKTEFYDALSRRLWGARSRFRKAIRLINLLRGASDTQRTGRLDQESNALWNKFVRHMYSFQG